MLLEVYCSQYIARISDDAASTFNRLDDGIYFLPHLFTKN